MKSKLNYKWVSVFFLMALNISYVPTVFADQCDPGDGSTCEQIGARAPESTPPVAAPAVPPASISAQPVHKKSAHDRVMEGREKARIDRNKKKEFEEITTSLKQNKNEFWYAINNDIWHSWDDRIKLENAYHSAMADLDNEEKQKAYDDVYSQTEKTLKKYYGRAKVLQEKIDHYNDVYDSDLSLNAIDEIFKSINGVSVEDDVVTITFTRDGDIPFNMNSTEDGSDGRATATSAPATPSSTTSDTSDLAWLFRNNENTDKTDPKETDGTCENKDSEPSALEKAFAWAAVLGAGYLTYKTVEEGRDFQQEMLNSGKSRVDTDYAKGRSPKYGMQMISAAYNYDPYEPLSYMLPEVLGSVNSLLSMSYGKGKEAAADYGVQQQELSRRRDWDQFMQWYLMTQGGQGSGNGSMSANQTTTINMQKMVDGAKAVREMFDPNRLFGDYSQMLDSMYQKQFGGVNQRQMQDVINEQTNALQSMVSYQQAGQAMKQLLDQAKQLIGQGVNMYQNVDNNINNNGGLQYTYTRTQSANGTNNFQGTVAGNPGLPYMQGPTTFGQPVPQNGSIQFGGQYYDPNGRGGQVQFSDVPYYGTHGEVIGWRR